MSTSTRDLEGQLLRRSEQPEFEADESDERRFTFPFSSTAPVARYFGDEVLEHEERSINFERLNESAPLLFNHDPDKVIGVVERGWLDGK